MVFKNLFLLLLMSFLLASCGDEQSQYDKGYDAAWEDEEEPSSIWDSQQKKDGYEDGLYDSDMYDDGYQDGIDNKSPKYLEDSFYMDGYKDGKASRHG
jgi:hypothetical protein